MVHGNRIPYGAVLWGAYLGVEQIENSSIGVGGRLYCIKCVFHTVPQHAQLSYRLSRIEVYLYVTKAAYNKAHIQIQSWGRVHIGLQNATTETHHHCSDSPTNKSKRVGGMGEAVTYIYIYIYIHEPATGNLSDFAKTNCSYETIKIF